MLRWQSTRSTAHHHPPIYRTTHPEHNHPRPCHTTSLANPTASGTQTAPGRRPLSKATPCTHTNPSTNQTVGATRRTRVTYKSRMRMHNTKQATTQERDMRLTSPRCNLPVFPCPCKSEPDKRYRYYHCLRLIRTPKKQATPTPIEAPCSPHSFTLAATNRNTISTEKRQRRKRTQATAATDQGMGLNPWPQHPIYTPPSTIHPNRVNRGKNTTRARKKPYPITQSRPRPPIEIAEDLAPNTPPGNRPLRPPQNKKLATIMIKGKPPTHCIPLSSSPEQVNGSLHTTEPLRR